MQFSLTLHYILNKRLVHSLGKTELVIWFVLHLLQMYKKLSCTTVDKQHEKITFGLIQKIIEVLHCKSFKRGATKHYTNVSMPAYKSSLASVILEKSIYTCGTIPLATWI